MRLPAGIIEKIITNPHKEWLHQYLTTFCGLVEAETLSGHGFILNNNGRMIGAYFKNSESFFRGKSALLHMFVESDGNSDSSSDIQHEEIYGGRILTCFSSL